MLVVKKGNTMKQKQITATGYSTFEDYEHGNGFAVELECDTIAEAKKRAKYLLTDEEQRLTEASEPLRYSQVLVNGECVADYFRK